MAPTGRRKDLINQDVGVIERVRKLEVLGNPRTLVPKLWKPENNIFHIIAEHITLLGCWRQGGTTWTYGSNQQIIPVASWASRYVYDLLTAEGFGNNAVKQAWTDFLWHMRAIPKPDWINVLDFSSGDDDTGPLAIFTAPWTTGAHPMNKRLTWRGLPSQGGPWTWYLPEGTWVAGFGSFPGAPHPGHRDADMDEVIGFGGWGTGLDMDECGIVRRNNTHGFLARDCGGPDGPPYNAYTQPGDPFEFDGGWGPCPNAPVGNVFEGGSITRVATWFPNDPYLFNPPLRNVGGGLNNELLFPYPGIAWLAQQAETYLAIPEFATVKAFYDRAIPAALANLKTAENKNWQHLALAIPWSGSIAAIRSQDKVLFRGEARWDSSGVVDEPLVAVVQSEALGMPTWFSGLDEARILIRTDNDSHPFAHIVFEPVGHFGPIEGTPKWYKLSWSPIDSDFRDGVTHGPLTLYFDGVSFPVRPGS